MATYGRSAFAAAAVAWVAACASSNGGFGITNGSGTGSGSSSTGAAGGSGSGLSSGQYSGSGSGLSSGSSSPISGSGSGSTSGSGSGSTSGSGSGSTSGSSSGSASTGSSSGSTSTSTGSSASSGTSSGGDGGSPAASTEDTSADCKVSSLPTTLTSNSKLPDPFTKLDGTRVATKADWHCRREEIRQLGQKFAYGTKPPKAQTVTGTVSSSTISVSVTDGGKSASFSVTVTPPTSGSPPYPAIITYTSVPLDPTVINSEGVALINYNPYDVGAEGNGRGTNQKGAFYSIYSGGSSFAGLLTAWGWGVSRIIDVIAQSSGTIINVNAIGVSGCSRFGKGAFIAGAYDDRIALTLPIESGTAGVPIWRGIPGEGAQTLSSAYSEQPWWADAFNQFTSDPTKAPLDTHEIVGLIAPRGLFIMDNPYIANLGPKSGDVAAMAGKEIYTALGAGNNITYWSAIASGTHCSMRPEWATPLKNNIEWFLKKTGTPAGVINASTSAMGNESSWVNWTTPTLN